MSPRATKHVMASTFNDFGLLKQDPEVGVISMPLVLPKPFIDQLDVGQTYQRWLDMDEDDDGVNRFARKTPSQAFVHSAQRTPTDCASWIRNVFGGSHAVQSAYGKHAPVKTIPGLDEFSTVLGTALHGVHQALGYKHYYRGQFEAKLPLPPDRQRLNTMAYHNVDTAIIVNVKGPSTEFKLNPTEPLHDKYAGEVTEALRLEGPHISVHRYGTWHAAPLPGPEGRVIYISGGSAMEMPQEAPPRTKSGWRFFSRQP